MLDFLTYVHELIYDFTMIFYVLFVFQKAFRPAVPNDIIVSFYCQAQKLVMAVYQLYVNQNNKYDIGNRHQVSIIEYSTKTINTI